MALGCPILAVSFAGTGRGQLGLNLGTVAPKSAVTLAYDVMADTAVESVPSLGPSASFSSREIGDPSRPTLQTR